jgi:hypothetical protein
MSIKNYKMSGKVIFAGNSVEDGKHVVTLEILPEQVDKVKELIGDMFKYDATPLKTNENTGEIYFKASSKFDVPIYEHGKETDELALSDIGKGSEVELFFGLGESSYKRSDFSVAYLKSVNVLKFVPFTKFNPYDNKADVETI